MIKPELMIYLQTSYIMGSWFKINDILHKFGNPVDNAGRVVSVLTIAISKSVTNPLRRRIGGEMQNTPSDR